MQKECRINAERTQKERRKKFGMSVSKGHFIIRETYIIGSPYCISAEDGQKVFDEILPLLAVGQKLILSFKGVGTLIPLFLNVAIGQLYGFFTEAQVRALVKVDGLAEDDLEMLKFHHQ